MTAPDDDTFHPGGTFGSYQLIERIGEGGMASVWRAMHLGLRKPVAIKTLRSGHAQSELLRDRFLREGEAISRIRHAHVVEVHDIGIVGDTPYLVMEFLEGEDLRAFFLRRGAIPLAELADIMVPVCAAIASTHDEGVVHRDVKPGNVFLARTRDRGIVPKVLDFGISRLSDDRSGRIHTGTEVVLGTPRYIAPEQVRGARAADERSDQYSIGVMLYQGATGQVPIDAPTIFELLQRVVSGDFALPRQVCPDLPAAFERVVVRAMSTRPDDRFASVRDLGAALLPFASERTRVIHGDALGQSIDGFAEPSQSETLVAVRAPYTHPVAVIGPPTASLSVFQPVGDPQMTMTLGGAPLELPVSAGTSSGYNNATKVLAAVAVVAFGLSLWLATRSAPTTSPMAVTARAPTIVAPPPVQLPVAPPVAAPLPVVSRLSPVLEAPPPGPIAVAPEAPQRPRHAPHGPRPTRQSVAPVTSPAREAPVVHQGPRARGGVNAHDID